MITRWNSSSAFARLFLEIPRVQHCYHELPVGIKFGYIIMIWMLKWVIKNNYLNCSQTTFIDIKIDKSSENQQHWLQKHPSNRPE